MATTAQSSSAVDPAIDLLYRYAAALDQFDYDGVLSMFDKPSRYRVQCRKNYERNGVLHIVNDTDDQLGFRLLSHPSLRLEPTVHVLGNPSARRDGDRIEVGATFNIDRNGKPLFSGEYIGTIKASDASLKFTELLVVLEGDSVPGSVQIPI